MVEFKLNYYTFLDVASSNNLMNERNNDHGKRSIKFSDELQLVFIVTKPHFYSHNCNLQMVTLTCARD